ncbi:MAG: ion channel [Eubacterium sp.]
MDNVVNELTINQTLANGDTIIFFYDIFVLLLFFFELFLYINNERFEKNIEKITSEKIKPIRRFILKLTKYYDKHGLITVNTLLLVISIIVISSNHALTIQDIIGIIASFLSFFLIMYFVQKLFVGLDSFKDAMVSRYVDVIFYILLGHYFVYFSPFVSKPDLFLTFIGLMFALLLCFTVMIRAIINPNILMKPTQEFRKNRESLGIIKGMGALMGCEISVLYLMIFSCFKTDPSFYIHAGDRALDALDLLYYLFVSFSTIGYGDIYPVRFEGMFYSQFTAIVISITSIFSTACFVGAVVAGAYNISHDNRVEAKKDAVLNVEEKKDIEKNNES